MKIHGKTGLMIATAYLIATLALGGCARQHIVSSPPAQRPAESATPAPAPAEPAGATAAKPADEPWQGNEGVYVVDAPATEESKAVLEDDLADDPDGGQGWVKATAPAPTPQPAATDMAQTEPVAPETATIAVAQGGKYFVQVGAFSDLENANRALARLIADGYKGSKLDATTDGLYRVQAGAFADPGEAGAALDRLRAQYPKGFVLKTD